MNMSGKLIICSAILLQLLMNPLYSQSQEIRFERLTVEQGLASSRVHGILEDRQGFMWFATDDGLHKYDGNKFTIYRPQQDNPFSISNVFCFTLLEDFEGKIWIGTFNGLNLMNKHDGTCSQLLNRPNDPTSLSHNYILDIYQKENGPVWISTLKGGVNKFTPYRNRFLNYNISSKNKNISGFESVKSIYLETLGDECIIWLGTSGGGLFRFDREKNEMEQYYDRTNQTSNFIRSIHQDPLNKNRLWIGTWGSGIHIFDKDKKIYPNRLTKDLSSFIYSIFQSNSGLIFVGGTNGLYIIDPTSNNFYKINNDYLTVVYEEKPGKLWLGTYGQGLIKLLYSIDSNGEINTNFEYYKYNEDDPFSLSNNTITCIYINKDSILWLGTKGGGLNRYNPQNDNFTHYTVEDGLPSDVIQAILEDNYGNLWLSTQNGLSKFNPITLTFRTFDRNDGILSNEFNSPASFKDNTGGVRPLPILFISLSQLACFIQSAVTN